MPNPVVPIDNSSRKDKAIKWKNTDTIEYFEKIPIEVFRNFAIKGGLEEGCDIDLIYHYIKDSSSLIEFGASYGRVIKNLIRKNYSGKIYAVERSTNFCNYLKDNYSSSAEIIQANVPNLEFPYQVDAILLMWSGIGEFPQEEQFAVLKSMHKWLKPHGIFILETILHTLVPKNATFNYEQDFIICSEYGTFYGYKPSLEEIHNYGKQLGFKYIKHINYETTTKRKRILHIFSPNPV